MKKILIPTITHDAANYISALEKVGLLPFLSSEMEEAENFDGLVLPGGGDIAPILFHETNKGSRDISITEDIMQLLILNRFIEAKKPVLGICKGMQLINVAFGGSLIQNIEHQGIHEYEKGDRFHKTRALPGSILQNLYGEYFITNSAHHQAIRLPGNDIIITQYSYDGIVEGIAHTSLPIIGVQWHPERLNDIVSIQSHANGLLLFEYFRQLLDQAL